MSRRQRQQQHGNSFVLQLLLLLLYCTTTTILAQQNQQTDDEDEEYVLGMLHPHTESSLASLITYAMVLCSLGWVALLFPFVFVKRFDTFIMEMNQRGQEREAAIIRFRRSRVFNPFRWILPTQYNNYVTVRFENTQGEIIKKEISVQEEIFERFRLTKPDTVPVYTLPDHPESACLEYEAQCSPMTMFRRMNFGVGAALLLGVGFWTSIVSAADVLFGSKLWWKFWVVLLGHGVALAIAYWGCNFGHRKRVESILYGTGIKDQAEEQSDREMSPLPHDSRSFVEYTAMA